MLPPFRIGANVNPAAMFANAYLIDTLYHVDQAAAQDYANLTGSILQRFFADPTTFPPDWLMLKDGTDVLICLAGTTKAAQWISHAGSAFFPIVDTTTGHFAVGSFYIGLGLEEAVIMANIGPLTGKTIRIAGHSYGAAAGFILALHLLLSPTPPARVEVMTFGEPRSQGGTHNTVLPESHDRIVIRGDPVQYTPPSVTMLFGGPKIISAIKLIGDGSWRHYGTPWELTPQVLQAYDNPVRYFFQEPAALLAFGVVTNSLHRMDVTYLPYSRDRWLSSGENPEYSALLPRVTHYLANQFVPPGYVGPPVTPTQENISWFSTPSGPITTTNQQYWQVASAVANVTPTGVSSMSQMKGSFLFNMGTGGFSESFYAVGLATLTYAEMQTKMLAILPYRMLLSRMQYQSTCKNPLIPYGLRVEDELMSRDALVSNINVGPLSGYVVPIPNLNDIFGQNIRQGNACQVKWCGDLSQQQVFTYLHGVALAATDDTLIDANAVEMLKNAEMSAQYRSALANYAHQIRLQGLGFRYLNSPWDVAGHPGPNAYPTAVTYNVTGQYYEFTMPSAPLAPFSRYVLRGFKNLNFLNGRLPGIAIGGTNIRILHKARSVTWDGAGTMVPEVWGFFSPNETVPVDPTKRPGAQHIAIVGKKIGRPFGGQRGRRSARAI